MVILNINNHLHNLDNYRLFLNSFDNLYNLNIEKIAMIIYTKIKFSGWTMSNLLFLNYAVKNRIKYNKWITKQEY